MLFDADATLGRDFLDVGDGAVMGELEVAEPDDVVGGESGGGQRAQGGGAQHEGA